MFNRVAPAALLCALFLLLTSGASAQDYRALYGSRGPRTCPSTKAPPKGPISANQAMQYFICGTEGLFGDDLYLVGNVTLQIGKGRPFLPNTDMLPDADVSALVYPVRGSYVRYQISKISKVFPNAGKNCNVYPQPHASGLCYRTTFGDWVCKMIDTSAPAMAIQNNVAPPQ
ncbi:hypothetical protein Q5H92_05685 [Hymenobacter sp. M29]|uniref:Uncharacterized protein n=1 Tax=Hymenobacter mellowenesis TaxID=3063995 RepID=A0ABT9A8Y9_9BACT|nr:hypothetical protein [Hymenobacter sp. M29]MDO7845839.1 hypothetical protein [Hymenobacter sp. M29]